MAIPLSPHWLVVMSDRHRSPHDDIDPTHRGPFDLVIFDMDGTVVDERSSWEWLHDHFGVSNETNWLRYERGEISDEEFMRADIALWFAQNPRIHVEDLRNVLQRATIMPGTRELVASLHAAGVATCILSGGLDLLAKRVCHETGIDMYVANSLTTDEEGYLRGEGVCVVEIRDKGRPTRDLLSALSIPKARAAAVGNSIWDGAMFREVGFSIAFAPFNDGIDRIANVTIQEKDMRRCAPYLLHPDATRP
ncbi:MAG: HAD-IB family phosphatase [Thermoplasmatota archaeon]